MQHYVVNYIRLLNMLRTSGISLPDLRSCDKTFSCLTHMSMNIVLVINFKIPSIINCMDCSDSEGDRGFRPPPPPGKSQIYRVH